MALSAPAFAHDYLSLGVGYYDVLDSEDAADFRLEYRPDMPVTQSIPGLKPWMGLQITSDASLWLGGGVLYDFELAENWTLTPSMGAGFHARGSSDLDLGYPLQFRSQLEVAYTLENENRIALAFGHTSNASLHDDNPGTEVLNIYWHKPL